MNKRRRFTPKKGKPAKQRAAETSAAEPHGNPSIWSSDRVRQVARNMTDPRSFKRDLCARLRALWHVAHFAPKPQKARIELLNTVIFACNLLQSCSEDFAEIAPFAPGWPLVLACTKERAREWKEAKRLVAKLQAGVKHPSRFRLESLGEHAGFVDMYMYFAAAELHNRSIAESLKVTEEDLTKLHRLALQEIAKTYGDNWQDDPAISKLFGKRVYRIGGEAKWWEECLVWEKRQIVRDKFKGAARTYAAQLRRFGKI